MKYFLIGYKSSGKTTLGKHLASKINKRFIDLDVFIEEKFNKKIPEIYTELGNDKFRVVERDALLEVIKDDNVIVATGGGTPCYFDNMEEMKKAGEVVYIKVGENALVERLKISVANGRPLVKGKNEVELYQFVSGLKEKYEDIFMKASHIIEGDNLQVDDLYSLLEVKNLL